MANTTTTFDTRPTYFGDRMIVTGSYTAGDGAGSVTISVSDLLASIDAVIVNPNSLQNQGAELIWLPSVILLLQLLRVKPEEQ